MRCRRASVTHWGQEQGTPMPRGYKMFTHYQTSEGDSPGFGRKGEGKQGSSACRDRKFATSIEVDGIDLILQ